jgi:hypothetical protein
MNGKAPWSTIHIWAMSNKLTCWNSTMCSLSSFGNNETKLELKDDKTSYMFHAPVHQISNHILQTQGNAATHTMCDDSQRALFASKCHTNR